ncbi:DMT family transporter [Pseudochryseolinea flava]|uniref:EamA/RhaT family transporter n=1 Tax=Pseudochryseolinea flava TaxID=2059302 RepID=A0A364Y759_9BACT|nr:DMT family transporter [Pseudochryseolinea flava]RAW02944.1 EamA/RhaT family transporter [Pseudochryseolinea flava]
MQTENESNRKLFLLGMILSMTCWGFSWTAGKYLSFYGNPITISFLRFITTFVSLYFLLLFLKTPLTIQKKGFLDLFIAAVLISVYTYLFFKGITLGQPGAGGVLVTVLNPIISYGIMLVMAKRRPTRNETIGLILGLLAGVVLLKLTTEAENIFKAGNIYFLLASFSWALLSLFTAKASRYGSPFTFSFLMYGLSTVLLTLVSNFDDVRSTLAKGDLVFWFNLIFSATITTSLATTFYFYATARIGASRASSFIFMVPLSAALGSWIFLDEVVQLHTIIGGLLGIAAVYILNKK